MKNLHARGNKFCQSDYYYTDYDNSAWVCELNHGNLEEEHPDF